MVEEVHCELHFFTEASLFREDGNLEGIDHLLRVDAGVRVHLLAVTEEHKGGGGTDLKIAHQRAGGVVAVTNDLAEHGIAVVIRQPDVLGAELLAGAAAGGLAHEDHELGGVGLLNFPEGLGRGDLQRGQHVRFK